MGQDWILCSERMPEEYESTFAKFKNTDKWSPVMWEKASNNVNVTSEFESGERIVETMKTIDGEWIKSGKSIERKVIAWQPFPEVYNGPEYKSPETNNEN